MKKLMIFGDSIIKGVTYNGQSYHLCQDHDFDTIAAQGVTVENHARMTGRPSPPIRTASICLTPRRSASSTATAPPSARPGRQVRAWP